jgi:hypothetical protein
MLALAVAAAFVAAAVTPAVASTTGGAQGPTPALQAPAQAAPMKPRSLGTLTVPSSPGPSFAAPIFPETLIPEREFHDKPEHDRATSASTSSGAATAAPAVPGSPVGSGQGLTSFRGLTHFDQRFSGSGAYVDTNFSAEPSDMALCVGKGYVVQGVNGAFAIFDTSGNPLSGAVNYNEFFGVAPAIDRTGFFPVYGDFTADPKCVYDPDTKSFFMTLLEAELDPVSGDFTGESSVLLAVSFPNNPFAWYGFSIPTTNDGTDGTPVHPRCPCVGDQPLIGLDRYGFWISTNEFPWFDPNPQAFNGAQVYGLSKRALSQGNAPPMAYLDLTDQGTYPVPPADAGENVAWYSLQPATTAPGSLPSDLSSGSEWFLSALDFRGTSDNRIAVWQARNTSSLESNNPQVSFRAPVPSSGVAPVKILKSQPYGQPPTARQDKPGSRPLAGLISNLFHLSLPQPRLNTNDDRMQQVVYARATLWGAMNTAVTTSDGFKRSGIAYYNVDVSRGISLARMKRQGYISVESGDLMFPAITINAQNRGIVAFTLSGVSYFPSAAFVVFNQYGSFGAIHMAGQGQLPADGFTGYTVFDPGDKGVERWGDYNAAAPQFDSSGKLWFAVENVLRGPRSQLANWTTTVGSIKP